MFLGWLVLFAQTDKSSGTFFDILNKVSLDQLDQRKELEPGAARSALVGASTSGGVRSFEASARLWAAKRWLELEVAWLRQADGQARRFILVLFYTQVADPDIAPFPPFSAYISKLNKEEAAQRQAELDWVIKEKAALKPRIDALLGK